MEKSIFTPQEDFYSRIAERSVTLREKIDHPERFDLTPVSEQESARLLEAWQNTVAPGDPEKFARRLANDGLDDDRARSLLGTVSLRDKGSLPLWVKVFRQITETRNPYGIKDPATTAATLFDEASVSEIPFIQLLEPFVSFATAEVEKKAGRCMSSLIIPEAQQMLHSQLARAMSYLASQTFYLEFRVFCATWQSPFSRLFATAEGNSAGNELYLAFVRYVLSEGWEKLFEEYSVLAKIITILIINWIENTSNFLLRLAADLPAIADRFCAGTSPGMVSEFKGGLSDSHDHGKSVIVLRFESGFQLVYKPRDLAVEEVWSQLITWFNGRGLSPELKPVEVIVRKEYGWVGFIKPAPCETLAEVERFYLRMGSLIGLIYMLNGNDCHQENLIASGEYPVLIDLESVMHPEAKTFSEEFLEHALYAAGNRLGSSVFRTGLLPSWISARDGFVYDISGLGGYGHAESPYTWMKWEQVNTDRMEVKTVPSVISRDHNLPELNGAVQPPEPWAEAISAGFSAVYRTVIDQRSNIPVHLFKGKEMRFIFRSTRIYALILKKLNDPKFMRSGTERGIHLELLCRAFVNDPAPNPFWAVCCSEMSQMEMNDIPIFRVFSDETSLNGPDGPVCSDFIGTPVLTDVAGKISQMEMHDLEKQVSFIRTSLLFRRITPHGNVNPESSGPLPADDTSPVTPGFLTDAVGKIFNDLRREAIHSADGSCTWLSPAIIPNADKYRIQPMSMFLYDGLAGVSLFLSALYSTTGDVEVKMLNESTLKALKTGMNSMKKHRLLMQQDILGITTGIPSVIYSLIRIAGFLDDPSLIGEARDFSDLITYERIDSDRTFDIMGGSAGCLLAYLHLYRVTGEREMLARAEYCGNHLLKHVSTEPDGRTGWVTLQNRMLSGFSHGQAGIAQALLRLYEVTGDERYRETAERAVAGENRLFSDFHQNWQDLRVFEEITDPSPRYMTSWCHGAPGIGLSRLRSGELFGSVELDRDIAAAMETTRKNQLIDRDHLCCGNLGRAEILLYGALKTNNPEWLAASGRLAVQVARKAGTNGYYTLFHGLEEEIFHPGFFQGISGIGYALLRQVRPDRLPSVLIFE